MQLISITTSTPIGEFHMIAERKKDKKRSQDVVRASGFGTLNELKNHLPQRLQSLPLTEAESIHPYQQLITAYFNGDTTALDAIPFQQEGSAFTQQVWDAIHRIPHGKTTSYKQLALASGYPKAIRAAGTACGHNHLALLVPCHRVLRTHGGIGNYGYGRKIKEHLLKMEQKA